MRGVIIGMIHAKGRTIASAMFDNPNAKMIMKPAEPCKPHTLYRTESLTAASCLALAVTTIGLSTTPIIADEAPAPSRVNALVNFEFANQYLTPRGMIVHDRGLTFQQLTLAFVNV
jgi:hypothetical protein